MAISASIGGQSRDRIARLDPTTGLADSFNPNANNSSRCNRGAGGRQDFSGRRVQQRRRTAARKHRPAGNRRQARPDARSQYRRRLGPATAVQPDGKLLIGGSFTSVLGVTRNNMARLNTDGTLDTAFNPNANGFVRHIWLSRRMARFWRAAISTGRTASVDRRATVSPGSMPPPDWLIRSTRTQIVLSCHWRSRRTIRFWSAAFLAGLTVSAARRATASPGSMP